MLRGFITGLLLCASITVGAEIYQWQDDNGIMQYGENPPAHRDARKVDINPPKSTDSERRQQQVEALIEAQREAEEAEQSRQQEAAQASKQAERKAENCKIARRNLEQYQNNPGRRFQNADGEVTRPTEAQRQQKILEFKQQTEQFCSQ